MTPLGHITIFFSLCPFYLFFMGSLLNVCVEETSDNKIVCPDMKHFQLYPSKFGNDTQCYYYTQMTSWNDNNQLITKREINYVPATIKKQLRRDLKPVAFHETSVIFYGIGGLHFTLLFISFLLKDLDCSNGHGDGVAIVLPLIPLVMYIVCYKVYEFSKFFYPICQ
jgi:hypothetical protein